MTKVKIYGAGSIGNHLAYASKSIGWDVLICDIDADALERTKTQIYPSRYGKWDKSIHISLIKDLPKEEFDVVIIGTPPDTHIDVALDVLRVSPPRVLLIEKPLCKPSLEGCQELLTLAGSTKTMVTVGYNHTLTQNSRQMAKILRNGVLGKPLTISATFREHWNGIFSAHPWLDGPKDSYLGFYERGGGASGEHSHAINIWQHVAHLLGLGRIVEVSAMLDVVNDGQVRYDRICQLSVRTDKDLVGDIVQDVITKPAQKYLRVQGTNGTLVWHVNWEKNCDAVLYSDKTEVMKVERIPKSRPDDFKGEIEHIRDLLEGNITESPISVERGLETMLVIAAAHISHRLKKVVRIDYEAGYVPEAIKA
jgi:predicted dehydrogenase